MNDSDIIVNKVANSSLATVDLEELRDPAPVVSFDLKPFLFMELLLKEKDFRESMDAHDWSQYQGAHLAVHCTSDAIIPGWAWMLVAAHAIDIAKEVHFGTPEQVEAVLFDRAVRGHDWSAYQGRKVLLKGCSDSPLPASAYVSATNELMRHADRVMYGEACSFVPVWRKPKVAG